MPGGSIICILITSTSCILPIGFSGGWTKYAGIALWLLFLASGLADIEAGWQYQRNQEQRAIKHARVQWERELKERELKQRKDPPGE